MFPVLRKEVQDYINANLKSDLHSLLLKKSPFSEISMQEIIQQIRGKSLAEKKFPFLQREAVVFPPNLNLEQTSSEATALYKAQFLRGEKLLDITCGFGIDALFISENFKDISLVEQNSDLLKIVQYNWGVLGKKAKFYNQKIEDFLSENKEIFDVVYLDPARRNEEKNKVFLLEDLSPNLLEIQGKLHQIAKQIAVKLSPLIDLKYLVQNIDNLVRIDIVALKNDVKEVLIFIEPNSTLQNILCNCVNLESDDEDFSFVYAEDNKISSQFSEPLDYLYIPNNSVLKSGAFNRLAEIFHLKKLHPNTHLYTSTEFIANFPGRKLKVGIVEPKKLEKNSAYNIISKNYPLKPEEIKKKYKLRDGGNHYLIFTQSINGKIVLKSI